MSWRLIPDDPWDPPVEISWDSNGISYETTRGTTDRLARRHIEQAELRERIDRLVRPVIPVKQLSRLSGVSHQTIYAFLEGRSTLQPQTARALSEALDKVLF